MQSQPDISDISHISVHRQPPRVIVADDHKLMLEGLLRILEQSCDVVGTASEGRELVRLTSELRPEIILLDVTMPLLNGVEAARQISRLHPDIKMIFVTMQSGREYVRGAFEAGASGYVLKHSAAAELVAAIQEVRQGRFFVSPMLLERCAADAIPLGQNPSKLFGKLTPRQREVLQLVAEGKSAKEIAGLLFISTKTVEFHKKHLMDELHLHTSAELVRYAVEQGWVGA